MSLRELAALFAPGMLAGARQRWRGPCALYAVALRDPLGGALFEALRAIGCVPRPLRKLAMIGRAPVVACAAPLDDLLGALRGLADADRWATRAGNEPATLGADELYRALDRATQAGGVAVLLAAAGVREVLPLDQGAPHVGAMFGAGQHVGLA